jgi:hypothetical protein
VHVNRTGCRPILSAYIEAGVTCQLDASAIGLWASTPRNLAGTIATLGQRLGERTSAANERRFRLQQSISKKYPDLLQADSCARWRQRAQGHGRWYTVLSDDLSAAARFLSASILPVPELTRDAGFGQVAGSGEF